MVGGVDHEAELAAWRLRLQQDQNDADRVARRRERRRDDAEQFEGRLLVLALAGVVYALIMLFG